MCWLGPVFQEEMCNMLGLELVHPGLLRSAQAVLAIGLRLLEGFLPSVGKNCSEPDGELQAVKNMLAVYRHHLHLQAPCCEESLELGFDSACLVLTWRS